MLNEMTMTKAMENNLVEVYNVKAHLSATSDKELEESCNSLCRTEQSTVIYSVVALIN